MRISLLFFLLSFYFLFVKADFGVSAQSKDNFMQERQDLQRLLAERAARFNSFTESLKKRSGIFGNKTKGDVMKSNEVLIQIVTTDNKLIDAMNRILSYKTFEKTNINYETAQTKEKLQQSMFITDTLTRQLSNLESENKQLHSKNIKLKGLMYLFLAALLITLIINYRRKKTEP